LKPTWREQLSYRFDNFMAKGPLALIGGLAIISILIIIIAALIITIGGRIVAPEGADTPGFIEAAWLSLMRTLDAGTMGGDAGWGFRLLMLCVTIGGIFVVSALIGVLNSGLEEQMERLRKGRSRVLENDHTLILGWSPQIFVILSELIVANENQKNASIVIMADRDKVEMEEEIRERVEQPNTTKIICRSGNPIDLNDLEIVSPHNARSIIILSPPDEQTDSHVIKTVLALTNNPNRRADAYHIVTQLHQQKNKEIIQMISPNDNVLVLITGDLIARIVAQTSRQSGLSVVYTELMNFSGDEIYFKHEPSLSGMTFAESLMAYDDSTVMGLQRSDGAILLNPPMNTRLDTGDKVFALSADDDTILLSGLTQIPIEEDRILANSDARQPTTEKNLIIGWNHYAPTLVHQLDAYVSDGSQLTVVANSERAEMDVNTSMKQLANEKVTFIRGDTTEREVLEKLNPMEYDHVIVLACDGLETEEADARTLVTLLHLRNIAERDNTPFSIVSEMLNLRNRELAEVARVDDFIISDHLISLIMAQLSENADLYPVYMDILDPEGSEIYLKPIHDYVQTGHPINLYTVVEAARRRGETLLGYRISAQASNAEMSYGVHTNPKKSEKVVFSPDDKVIVISAS